MRRWPWTRTWTGTRTWMRACLLCVYLPPWSTPCRCVTDRFGAERAHPGRPPPPHPLPLAYGWAPAARPSSRASLAVVACRTDHPRCQLVAVWLRVQAPSFACFCMTEFVPSKRKKRGGHVVWPGPFFSTPWPQRRASARTWRSVESRTAPWQTALAWDWATCLVSHRLTVEYE